MGPGHEPVTVGLRWCSFHRSEGLTAKFCRRERRGGPARIVRRAESGDEPLSFRGVTAVVRRPFIAGERGLAQLVLLVFFTKNLNNFSSDSIFQKLIDGYRVYKIYEGYNLIYSFYRLLVLSYSFIINNNGIIYNNDNKYDFISYIQNIINNETKYMVDLKRYQDLAFPTSSESIPREIKVKQLTKLYRLCFGQEPRSLSNENV